MNSVIGISLKCLSIWASSIRFFSLFGKCFSPFLQRFIVIKVKFTGGVISNQLNAGYCAVKTRWKSKHQLFFTTVSSTFWFVLLSFRQVRHRYDIILYMSFFLDQIETKRKQPHLDIKFNNKFDRAVFCWCFRPYSNNCNNLLGCLD